MIHVQGLPMNVLDLNINIFVAQLAVINYSSPPITVRHIPALFKNRSKQHLFGHRWSVATTSMSPSRSRCQRDSFTSILLEIQWSKEGVCALKVRRVITRPHTRQRCIKIAKYACPSTSSLVAGGHFKWWVKPEKSFHVSLTVDDNHLNWWQLSETYKHKSSEEKTCNGTCFGRLGSHNNYHSNDILWPIKNNNKSEAIIVL